MCNLYSVTYRRRDPRGADDAVATTVGIVCQRRFAQDEEKSQPAATRQARESGSFRRMLLGVFGIIAAVHAIGADPRAVGGAVSQTRPKDGCVSAWGPDADRRPNLLTPLSLKGSHFAAYSQLLANLGENVVANRSAGTFKTIPRSDNGEKGANTLALLPARIMLRVFAADVFDVRLHYCLKVSVIFQLVIEAHLNFPSFPAAPG